MIRALFLLVVLFLLALSAPERAGAAVAVTLEGDSTLTVAVIAWNSTGYVTVVRPDGTEKFIGVQKIKKIADEEGNDRTRDVLENRQTVGTPPPGYKGRLGRGPFTIGKGLILGVFVAILAAAVVVGQSFK